MTTTDLQIRRESWARIRAITSDPFKSDARKLSECLNESNVYAALTGDDSLTPPPIVQARVRLLDSVDFDRIQKGKAYAEKEAKRGQSSLL